MQLDLLDEVGHKTANGMLLRIVSMLIKLAQSCLAQSCLE
jgi:hypothetical protein